MIKEIISNKYLLLLSRLVLGFLFIYSGIEKISDLSAFSDSISNYKLFPLFSVNIIAVIIPWLELITGLLLLLGISVRENAVIISSLLILFLVLIVISLFRGLDINCGCFGTNSAQSIGLTKILENLFLLLMGIQLIFLDSNHLSIKNFS